MSEHARSNRIGGEGGWAALENSCYRQTCKPSPNKTSLGHRINSEASVSSAPICMLSRFSRVRLFSSPWTVACQAPLSVGFSRQDYWSGWPCPPPGDHPDPGIEPTSHVSCIGRHVLYR